MVGFIIASDGTTVPTGILVTPDGTKVTYGFELHCNVADKPNNLEINWKGNKFHLESWENAACYDDPSISPNPPDAPFDRL